MKWLWALSIAFLGITCAMGAPVEVAPGVLQLGIITNIDINESSGLNGNRRGVFWTHNDGAADKLYAISSTGESLGSWKIADVTINDWEDLASAGAFLFIADIGNNNRDRTQ